MFNLPKDEPKPKLPNGNFRMQLMVGAGCADVAQLPVPPRLHACIQWHWGRMRGTLVANHVLYSTCSLCQSREHTHGSMHAGVRAMHPY